MLKRTLAALLAGTVLLSGCGSSDDPDDKSTVKVAISAKLEAFAPLLVGLELGSYADQDLDVEIVTAAPSDAMVLLATGEVDAVFSAPSAAFFNAVSGGSPIKIVAPGMFPPENSRSGLWVSDELAPGGTFDPAKLRGETVATAVGAGAPVSMVLEEELERSGLSAADVTFQTMSATDILVALESGAVKAGWLSDPVWLEAEKSDGLTFAFGQPEDITMGAVLFGPTLLEEDRDRGERLLAGMRSAVADHLQGAYHDDPEVRAALVKQLEISEAQLDDLPELVFPPDLTYPAGLTDRYQATYAGQKGVLVYSDPLAEDEVIDASLAK
ncbi:ABC transporter substrate-binding protein [Nocardioides carbamazepini]|uniref:ABC transporter substrate-binding protein n=1 Tax=Nocardioides carbamazepini TaxID=2854259 RepID=UPI00214A5E94|nr:ABC transporter substrate-binding protein [Nocardioides carbamazepini]MCR1782557.1 ABC transporter substrate-binding protein [Nocardioides carbamazepini]